MAGAPLFRRYGIEPIYAQCVGVLVGGVLQLALQMPALRALDLMPRVRRELQGAARRLDRPDHPQGR